MIHVFEKVDMYRYAEFLKKVTHIEIKILIALIPSSRVFLQRQLWIVNYYVKSSSNNLNNENIKAVSREMLFQK